MPTSDPHTCIACGADAALVRGLCWDRCYPRAYRDVRAGKTTWEQLESTGKARAPSCRKGPASVSPLPETARAVADSIRFAAATAEKAAARFDASGRPEDASLLRAMADELRRHADNADAIYERAFPLPAATKET